MFSWYVGAHVGGGHGGLMVHGAGTVDSGSHSGSGMGQNGNLHHPRPCKYEHPAPWGLLCGDAATVYVLGNSAPTRNMVTVAAPS